MYDFFEGEVASRGPARVSLLVAGVAYEFAVPVGTDEALPARAPARLHAHLVVTDGTPRLFGFATREERDLFRLVLGVSGVGPATGLSLLSSLRPPELAAAIDAGDLAALRRVRGVGEKTAQRLLLELRGKLAISTPADRVEADAAAALLSLGYTRREAEEAVASAAKSVPTRDLESIVRAVLSGGAKRGQTPAGRPTGPRARTGS